MWWWHKNLHPTDLRDFRRQDWQPFPLRFSFSLKGHRKFYSVSSFYWAVVASLHSLWTWLPIDGTGCLCWAICLVQLLHQDKQTPGLPGDSSAADWAWAEILYPIPCAVQDPEFPDSAQKRSSKPGGLFLRQEKEGVHTPNLISDLIPLF